MSTVGHVCWGNCGWRRAEQRSAVLQHKKQRTTNGARGHPGISFATAGKRQSGWSFRTLGLAEVWCEALTAATSYTLKPRLKRRWVFSKALWRITCKSWNGTTGMGWHLSQQPSLPRINATLLGSQPLHTLAGQKGEDSVPATSGPSAFHANGEKIHMPLCLHPNHFREAERKVMKEKVREGKPERQGKRGRGRE